MGNSHNQSPAITDFSKLMDWTPHDVYTWCRNNGEIKHLSKRLYRLRITGRILANVPIDVCVEDWGLSWLDSFKLLDERDGIVRISTLAQAGQNQQRFLLECHEKGIAVSAENFDVRRASTQWTKETLIAWLALQNLSHLSVLVTENGLTAKDLPCLTAKTLVTVFQCGWTDAFALISARDKLFSPSTPSLGMDSDSGTITPYDSYISDDDCEEDLDGFVFLEYDD